MQITKIMGFLINGEIKIVRAIFEKTTKKKNVEVNGNFRLAGQ